METRVVTIVDSDPTSADVESDPICGTSGIVRRHSLQEALVSIPYRFTLAAAALAAITVVSVSAQSAAPPQTPPKPTPPAAAQPSAAQPQAG